MDMHLHPFILNGGDSPPRPKGTSEAWVWFAVAVSIYVGSEGFGQRRSWQGRTRRSWTIIRICARAVAL